MVSAGPDAASRWQMIRPPRSPCSVYSVFIELALNSHGHPEDTDSKTQQMRTVLPPASRLPADCLSYASHHPASPIHQHTPLLVLAYPRLSGSDSEPLSKAVVQKPPVPPMGPQEAADTSHQNAWPSVHPRRRCSHWSPPLTVPLNP